MFLIPLRVVDHRSFGVVPVVNVFLATFMVFVFLMGWRPMVGPDEPWYAIFTYAFGHANGWHLIGNMMFLVVYGNALNSRLGNAWYAVAFLICAVMVGLATRLLCPGPAIGASGAIFGVIAMTAILLPAANIEFQWVVLAPFTLIFAAIRQPAQWWQWWVRFGDLRVPAVAALVLTPLLELLSLCSTGWNWSSLMHLIGFVAGVLLVALLPDSVVLERRWARS